MSNGDSGLEAVHDAMFGHTWREVRSQLLASALAARPQSFCIRAFQGERLSAVFDRSSGHTHILNHAGVKILTEIADGGLHPVRQLVAGWDGRSADTVLQTVISLKDKGLANLVPLDSSPIREDIAGNPG